MRHAVYFAPDPQEPLHALAASWLGRDPVTGETLAPPDLLARDEHEALVAAPRRYGFHATLKAPFRLAEGATPEGLDEALEGLAGRVGAVRIPVLSLQRLGPFFALVPALPIPALDDFAASIVKELDPFRAQPASEELARRREAGLTERQAELLERWGYPYVLDEFRFHMTLTGPVPEDRAPVVEKALTTHFEKAIGRSLTVDRLCRFVEPLSGEDFQLVRTHPIRRPLGAGVVRVELH
ncbi:DUF1045 domain-containing protein [Lutibaculum baratangense]|uniref:Protein RcsF n=1 Tax=Lutibaculum baratangense AMV1 TaxID=631454 RepID=V4QVR7_9HYPH|nr:DUF1045 domain-containing protein [Lutibaculum baratangense]ESR23847.1 Protein RcsF [Lutibaculum baratangense AMV1]